MPIRKLLKPVFCDTIIKNFFFLSQIGQKNFVFCAILVYWYFPSLDHLVHKFISLLEDLMQTFYITPLEQKNHFAFKLTMSTQMKHTYLQHIQSLTKINGLKLCEKCKICI